MYRILLLSLLLLAGCRPNTPNGGPTKAEGEAEVARQMQDIRKRELDEQQYRTWLSRTGEFELRAKFISLKDGVVTLERYADRQRVRVPLADFLESDQEVLKEMAAARR